MDGEDYAAGRDAARSCAALRSEAPDPEPEAADFAINARVRHILTRRWIKREGLQIGTTDGVVVVRGPLERESAGPGIEESQTAHDQFLRRLRTELLGIPGVVDVVMEICNSERTDSP